MKLTARVVGLEDGSCFVDEYPRVTFHILEADCINKIRLSVTDINKFKLGDLHDCNIAPSIQITLAKEERHVGVS